MWIVCGVDIANECQGMQTLDFKYRYVPCAWAQVHESMFGLGSEIAPKCDTRLLQWWVSLDMIYFKAHGASRRMSVFHLSTEPDHYQVEITKSP